MSDYNEPISTWDEWPKKTLWYQCELQALCLGLNPECNLEPYIDELNQIEREIRDSVDTGTLKSIARGASATYGKNHKFTPQNAIEWAAQKFPKFPFKPKPPIKDLSTLTQENEQLNLLIINAQAQIEELENKLTAYKNGTFQGECCNEEHSDYPPELHQAIKAWESLYIDNKILRSDNSRNSHSQAIDLWIKNNAPDLKVKREIGRLKTFTTPRHKKSDGTEKGDSLA